MKQILEETIENTIAYFDGQKEDCHDAIELSNLQAQECRQIIADCQKEIKAAQIKIANELITKFFAGRIDRLTPDEITDMNSAEIFITLGEINDIITAIWQKYGL